MSGTRSKGKGKGKGKKSGKADDMPDVFGSRSKKRRYISDSDDDDDMPKRSSPSISKLMNRSINSGPEKPAELFRKDLISAMKLPDSEPLLQEEYILISDPWRQEWEKGVQVPVNPDFIPAADIRTIKENDNKGDFKMPRKFLHAAQDETYKPGYHELTGMSQLADLVCRYDLDDQDVSWLHLVNREREEMGLSLIHEWTMEKIMEELEIKCHDNIEAKIKNSVGLGIEYDEDVVCDVCRSPDSEENNEMVFCDKCDICVHQACYGITTIPDGNWLCRMCALGIKPSCLLCPKTGGAMKSTKSGTKWAHVSCALWIPEVSIGCVDRMEPITKISMIPASRWALCCCLCRERVGACIQCSVKSCKTAFHVTCAFQHSLEMKTILDENDFDDGVKLKAFCPKHTKHIKERGIKIADLDGYRSPRKDSSAPGSPMKTNMTEAERENLRLQKIEELKEEFYTCVTVQEVFEALTSTLDESSPQVDKNTVDLMYEYWKLKRQSLFNKPLMTPKRDEADLLYKQQENSLIARMKMFVHLRQDLERVRNLCYMVGRREKIRRSYYKLREQLFRKQMAYLDVSKLTKEDVDIAREASASSGVYDEPDFILKADRQREKLAQQLDSANNSHKTHKGHKLIETEENVEVDDEISTKELLPKIESPIHELQFDVKESPRTRRTRERSPNIRSPKRELEFDINNTPRTLRSPKNESICERETRSSPKRVDDSERNTRPVRNLSISETSNKVKSKPVLKVDNESVDTTDAPIRRELRSRNPSARSDSDKNVDECAKSDTNKKTDDCANKIEHPLFAEKPMITRDLNDVKKLSRFVISKKIRDKVQNKVYSSRRLKPVINGLLDTTQRRLDTYFKPIPKKTFSPQNKNNSNNGLRELRVSLSRSPVGDTENMSGRNSPSVRGNRSTRKENTPTPTRRYLKSEHLANGLYDECLSPETRSTRRKIATLDSNSNDKKLFESVDSEISLCRSSRDVSPDQDSPRTLRSGARDLDFNTSGAFAHLKSTRKRASNSLMLDNVFVDVENNSDVSESGSDISTPVIRRSRRIDTNEDSSCDSSHSVNRYPTRSR